MGCVYSRLAGGAPSHATGQVFVPGRAPNLQPEVRRHQAPPVYPPASRKIAQRMIAVENLTKVYGTRTVLRDVSFTVQPGEILGFLGPNGAGKTTTMRILTGYMPPTSGTATVAGFDVVKQSLSARRKLGYLPETVPLYPEMSIRGYLDYMAKVKGVPRKVRKQRVDEVMEQTFVAHRQKDLIGRLSKGYRQRVGLAQALVGDPDVLILDEPTV